MNYYLYYILPENVSLSSNLRILDTNMEISKAHSCCYLIQFRLIFSESGLILKFQRFHGLQLCPDVSVKVMGDVCVGVAQRVQLG